MKIKNFMEQGAFSEMPPEQWSGEYVSDYLTQFRDAITEVMTDTELGSLLMKILKNSENDINHE